jgi:GNAT superfamily N-acetyltransferase
VTDAATFAYLGDVFVLDEQRGKGVGKQLVEAVMAHPDVQGVRLFLLGTADAHGLYERYGFKLVEQGRWMAL